jgi:hypothetical protein
MVCPSNIRPPFAFVLRHAVLTGALAWAPFAHGEEVAAENKAAARDLATEGIKLAQAGKCNEAIPQLQRAEKLFHAPTILTWIGQCQLELGRYVEGTETLNRVIREKIEPSAPEAYLSAQSKARELVAQASPKIAKLTVEVSPEDIEGLTVKVGGQEISSALIGAPRPTDPGEHVIQVSAPGYGTRTQQVELGEGKSETVSFQLEADGTGTSSLNTTGEEHIHTTTQSSTRAIGWITLGVGGALMAGGGVMGYLALGKKNDLNCDENRICPPAEENNLNAARGSALVSTVLFGVGGAAAVTGLVLVLTGKPKAETAGIYSQTLARRSVEPYVGPGSMGLYGRF